MTRPIPAAIAGYLFIDALITGTDEMFALPVPAFSSLVSGFSSMVDRPD